MMRQYDEAKKLCGDALLLFRMGDFYELFHQDAVTTSKVLGLTLTSRDKGENAIAMAGFPYHQLDSYMGKLIKQGYRVAVCEQVEDPKTAKGTGQARGPAGRFAGYRYGCITIGSNPEQLSRRSRIRYGSRQN